MFEVIANIRTLLRWQDLMDILLVSIVLYRILILFKGTKAVQMSTGLGVILIGYYLAERLEFFTLHTILDRKSTRLNSSHSQQSRMPSSA